MILLPRMILFALLGRCCGCHIQLDILPKTIRLESSRHVTLRCSRILARTETVYSIMLKKGEATVVVLLPERIKDLTEGKYNITGSVTTISSSAVFLQLFLDKVTCLDRGNYSCIMAVNTLGIATTMEPVSSRLEIKGEPRGMFLILTPDTPAYTDGEVVNITCYVLLNSHQAFWSWSAPNENEHTELNNCTYNESECIYMCISSVLYTVTMQGSGSRITCQTGGFVKHITLNLSNPHGVNGVPMNKTTNVPLTDMTLASSGNTTPPERGGIGMMVLYVLVLAFAVALVFTLLYLFLSDRKCKCHNHPSKNSHFSKGGERARTDRTRPRVMVIQPRNRTRPLPNQHRGYDETGCHETAYLHPQHSADSSVSQNIEPVYDEID
ncbi:uncharacterized protein LOC124114554 [Haliotis rufescens]|uniref:uncharacterized protein LOC124114554 n=1 Tax=Haliotis rufescens TaxID=6454 RepID=UPI00201F98EF|nr:uncharacterized protein LOC124114554 [Haliotis rufescens]